MDMNMYALIKDAMKKGKSADDVIAEVNALTQTAKKELAPKTPIKDKYGRLIVSVKDESGKINKSGLVAALACYFVQNGFEPDVCFDDYTEFTANIREMLDRNLSILKSSAKQAQMNKDGASDEECMAALFKTAGDMISDLFKR